MVLGSESQRRYPNVSLIGFLGQFEKSKRESIKVLEVGCGTGANLWMIAKEGFQGYGVDGSEYAIQFAQKALQDVWDVEANIQIADFSALPFADGFFDIVVDVLSLEHVSIEETSVCLREFSRVLKNQGHFFSYRLGDRSSIFLNTPESKLDHQTIANVSTPGRPFHNNGKISFWSPGVALDLLAKHELKVESIEIFTRTYPNNEFVEYLSIVGKKLAIEKKVSNDIKSG